MWCVSGDKEGVLARLEVRHVPTHVPWLQHLGEKRGGCVWSAAGESVASVCVQAKTEGVVGRD